MVSMASQKENRKKDKSYTEGRYESYGEMNTCSRVMLNLTLQRSLLSEEKDERDVRAQVYLVL